MIRKHVVIFSGVSGPQQKNEFQTFQEKTLCPSSRNSRGISVRKLILKIHSRKAFCVEKFMVQSPKRSHVGFTINIEGYFVGRKIKKCFNKINYIMSNKDGRPTREDSLHYPNKRKFTFITAVTLKRQWELLQQWN